MRRQEQNATKRRKIERIRFGKLEYANITTRSSYRGPSKNIIRDLAKPDGVAAISNKVDTALNADNFPVVGT